MSETNEKNLILENLNYIGLVLDNVPDFLMENKKTFHPQCQGRKETFRGTTRDSHRFFGVHFSSDNGDDPSAHFLAEAPGRTKRHILNRLSAAGRSSLLHANSFIFPFNAHTSHLYHRNMSIARGN